MKDKWLYSFEIEEIQKVKETEKTQDESGKEVEITKEVEKPVKKIFKILNPSRKLQEESSIFYSIKVSEGIKMGLLTRAYLMRKFQKDGVLPSEEEKKIHAENYSKAIKLEIQLQELELNKNNDKDNDLKIKNITEEYENLKDKIFEFENIQNSLFENTAEYKANSLLSLWNILFLLYFGEEGKESCVFGDGDFEQKKARMHEIEDSENQTIFKAVERASFVIGQLNSGVKPENIE
jgi:hypothetical protein